METMKHAIKLLAILALALAAFGQHSSASAGGVFKSRGKGASAIFSSVDGSGCVVTDVFVNPNEGYFQSPPGRGSTSSGVYLAISRYDFCTATQLLSADGFTELADEDFQVFGNLMSAALNATVNVFDYVSMTSFDVYIDLVWTGSGGLNRQSTHTHFSSPGCKGNLRYSGSFRGAIATGTVSDGWTNYTPEPSLGYDIYQARSAEVYIGCN
jgi:hypothetical protein